MFRFAHHSSLRMHNYTSSRLRSTYQTVGAKRQSNATTTFWRSWKNNAPGGRKLKGAAFLRDQAEESVLAEQHFICSFALRFR